MLLDVHRDHYLLGTGDQDRHLDFHMGESHTLVMKLFLRCILLLLIGHMYIIFLCVYTDICVLLS